MAPKNIESLRTKRARAQKQIEHWQSVLTHAAKMLGHHLRREKLYTTLIEKALDEKKTKPKDPTRVVEV